MSGPTKRPVLGHEAPDIVDTQLHLTLEMTEARISSAMDALGIRSVLIDELWSVNEKMQGLPCIAFAHGVTRPLSPYAQAAAFKQPERFAYIQRVERRDPQIAEHLAVLASSPACKALRLVLLHPMERLAFSNGDYHALLCMAEASGLPVCLFAQDTGPLLEGIVGRYPALPFVLDHCGFPRAAGQWEGVLALAKHPNVYLKWSHAFHPFRRGENPAEALQQQFLRALEAFGPERIVWASDASHDETTATWADLLAFVRDNPALSSNDRHLILAGTARRLFRWPATPLSH